MRGAVGVQLDADAAGTRLGPSSLQKDGRLQNPSVRTAGLQSVTLEERPPEGGTPARDTNPGRLTEMHLRLLVVNGQNHAAAFHGCGAAARTDSADSRRRRRAGSC